MIADFVQAGVIGLDDRMENDNRTHGLWELSSPPAPPTQKLAENIDSDVVVIGAGYTGISTALHLALAGKKVVVVEAAEIAFGASGRNSGLVNAGMWVMPDDLIETLGPVYGDRLIKLLGASPDTVFGLIQSHGIDCQADRRGTYHCAVGAAGLQQIQDRTRQWQRLGAAVEFLDAARTAKQTGVDIYLGSLFDPRAGTIQPLAYARGLAAAAIKAGVDIYTWSPATEYRRSGSDWHVKTAQGSVRAEWLVVASDAYSSGPTKDVRNEQIHMPYFHVSTPPLPASATASILPDGGAAWNTKTVLSHFRLDNAGRLIVGSIGSMKGVGLAVHRSWAKRHIRKLFPQIGHVELETEWYGMIGMNGDHLPRLHVYGEKAIGFSAYNGRGIAPGTVFGAELARHILGEASLEAMALPVKGMEFPNFRKAREVYYELGAQIAHLPLSPM